MGSGCDLGGFEFGASPALRTLAGRAYGLRVAATALGVPLNLPAIPDTGPVSTTDASTTSVPCVANLPAPVRVVRLVLNEQIPSDTGLTVNAIHATVNAGAGALDLVLASAESGIGGCP